MKLFVTVYFQQVLSYLSCALASHCGIKLLLCSSCQHYNYIKLSQECGRCFLDSKNVGIYCWNRKCIEYRQSPGEGSSGSKPCRCMQHSSILDGCYARLLVLLWSKMTMTQYARWQYTSYECPCTYCILWMFNCCTVLHVVKNVFVITSICFYHVVVFISFANVLLHTNDICSVQVKLLALNFLEYYSLPQQKHACMYMWILLLVSVPCTIWVYSIIEGNNYS